MTPRPSPDSRHGRWRTGLSVAAAALDLAALGALLLPVGGMSCSSVAVAPRPGQPVPPPAPSLCHAVPAITAFAAALPALALMIVLGLVPLLTLRLRLRWPAAASAALQAVLQFLAFGAFAFWIPTWLLTIAAAAVPPEE